MEDYKKKYEEALDNFKKIKAANKDNKELVHFIEYEYPELKESEDERIGKALAEMVHDTTSDTLLSDYGINKEDALIWLEKRVENFWKPSDEQMKALNYVINLMASNESPTENDYYYNVLKDVRTQLKKLKGE